MRKRTGKRSAPSVEDLRAWERKLAWQLACAVEEKKPGMIARARRSYVAAPDKFSVSER